MRIFSLIILSLISLLTIGCSVLGQTKASNEQSTEAEVSTTRTGVVLPKLPSNPVQLVEVRVIVYHEDDNDVCSNRGRSVLEIVDPREQVFVCGVIGAPGGPSFMVRGDVLRNARPLLREWH